MFKWSGKSFCEVAQGERVSSSGCGVALVVVVRSLQHNASRKRAIGNTLLTLCLIEIHILSGAVVFLFNCKTVRQNIEKTSEGF